MQSKRNSQPGHKESLQFLWMSLRALCSGCSGAFNPNMHQKLTSTGTGSTALAKRSKIVPSSNL